MLVRIRDLTAGADLMRRIGTVRELSGLAILSDGPDVALGEICEIRLRDGNRRVRAEVVGLRRGVVALMPYGGVDGLATGCAVVATGRRAQVPVGDGMLGRIVDGFGNALDGRPAAPRTRMRDARGEPVNPLQRPRIDRVLETGVRALDTLLTLGRGQRVGIFAGSGVGKSTLLGMIARHVRADVNVIAMIGERGREVREFIDEQLGPAGLRRSVVVAAPADQPALARLHAAYAAVAIAEEFRERGRHVLLTMDSVTRFAMARREVGLAAGEPPTARGYTPSVFAEIPQMCERCGTSSSGGSITAVFTVLVEGDDPNEPIADCLRATLDGHIVLSRALVQQGHFPAIDVLKSASRVMGDIVPAHQRAAAMRAVATLDLLERNRQLVELGAYTPGTHPALDQALALKPGLFDFLRQAEGGVPIEAALRQLADVLREVP